MEALRLTYPSPESSFFRSIRLLEGPKSLLPLDSCTSATRRCQPHIRNFSRVYEPNSTEMNEANDDALCGQVRHHDSGGDENGNEADETWHVSPHENEESNAIVNAGAYDEWETGETSGPY